MTTKAFGYTIKFNASGMENLLNAFRQMQVAGAAFGATAAQMDHRLKFLRKQMQLAGASADDIAEAYKRITNPNYDNARRRLDALQNTQKTRLDEVKEKLKEAGLIATQFYVALAPVKKLYAFTDGIARLNYQLRMLHYSSGMGVASLSELGAAAKLYGGSEKTVASFKDSYDIQLQKARRGEGLGMFDEAAWKFGFAFDPDETAEHFFERAIKTARGMDTNTRKYFAQVVGGARKQELLARAALSREQDDEIQKYFRKASLWENGSGENRKEGLLQIEAEYTVSKGQLARSWEGVKDQIATALLPVITAIINGIRKVTDFLNRFPKLLSFIAYLLGTIVTLVSAVSFYHALASAFTFIASLKEMVFLAKMLRGLLLFRWVMPTAGFLKKAWGAIAGAGKASWGYAVTAGKNIFRIGTGVGHYVKLMFHMRTLIGALNAFRMATGAVRVALIGSTGLLVAAAGALGFGIGYLGEKLIEKAIGVDKNKYSGNKDKDGTDDVYRQNIADRYRKLVAALKVEEGKSDADSEKIEFLKKRIALWKSKLDAWGMDANGKYASMVEGAETTVTNRYVNNSSSKETTINDNRRIQLNNTYNGADPNVAQTVAAKTEEVVNGSQLVSSAVKKG